MNLSDLVHRSTNGHHDHPIDSFFVPTNIHQQKSQDPSSSSSSTTVPATATTTTTATATSHPFLYESTIYSSSQTLNGLPDAEDRYSPIQSSSPLQHSSYFDPSASTGTQQKQLQNTTPPGTTTSKTTVTSPSQPSYASSSSPLNEFYTPNNFFQPTSPPMSSIGTLATISHISPSQQQVQEDHLPINKATTPLSSSPSSPPSSSLPSFTVDAQNLISRPSSQQAPLHHHVSKRKSLGRRQKSDSEKSTTTTTPAIATTTATATTETALPLDDEELLRRKRHSRLQPLTITGDNVSADNIEDGYIQFILHHDPDSIGDGIDSLMYVRRKFSSVPRTGDLSYTTWDVYILVNKLYNREIKNWSQLVGQLGLSDMLGRPQFAQRVKRWMHKYKIDYYFDYLMGTPFDFFSEDEKYSGCLLMGNYQKRKELGDWSVGSGDDSQQIPATTRKRRRRIAASSSSSSLAADNQTMTDGDGQSSSGGGGDASQRPILMAGSRKRMRGDTQQSSLLLVDKQRPDETDDDNNDDDDDEDDDEDEDMDGMDEDRQIDHGSDDDGMNVDEDQGSVADNDNHQNNDDHDQGQDDDDDDPTHSRQPGQLPTIRKRNLEKEMDEDEEDELASTSSTSGSPVQSPALPVLPPPSSPSHQSNSTNAALSPPSESAPSSSPHDRKLFTETTIERTTAGPNFGDSSSPSTISFHLFDPIPHTSTANTNTTTTTTHSAASASSSSSPSSPPIPAASNMQHVTTTTSSATTPDNLCTSCDQVASTVADLQTKISILTQHMDTFVSKWKPMMESRCKSLQQQIDTLTDENEKMHAQWTLWRKNLLNGLLEDPFQ